MGAPTDFWHSWGRSGRTHLDFQAFPAAPPRISARICMAHPRTIRRSGFSRRPGSGLLERFRTIDRSAQRSAECRRAAGSRNAPTVHLHDREPVQGVRQEGRPQGDLAVVLSGGQDRRARRQRLGQEHAAADHGRRREGLPRHRAARAGDLDRLSAAGADARPDQGRPRQRRAGRRPSPRPARAVRRDQRPARRADRRRRDGPAARGAGQGPGRDRGGARVGPRPPDRDRHGRHAAAARRRRRGHPLRRRAAAGRALQDPAPAARPAPARRADQPPRRRERRLARTAPAGVSRDGRRGHPRPLLPRQRRRLDPRTRPRPGHPLAGQLLVVARAEAGAARPRGEAGERPPQDPGPRAGVGPHGPPRPRRQEPGPAPALRAARQPGRRERATRSSCSRSRPARTSATSSSRPRTSARGTATGCCSRT